MVLQTDADEAPPGEDVSEPVYGAPARWIDADRQDEAALSGQTVVTPSEVLATHLLEMHEAKLDRLMTLKALRRLLDADVTLSDSARAEANRRMLDELMPDKVPLDVLLAVLRLLLVRTGFDPQPALILEAIAEVRGGAAIGPRMSASMCANAWASSWWPGCAAPMAACR
jgi:flagellar biosynthesis protein FlhA